MDKTLPPSARAQIRSLEGRLGFANGALEFLAYKVDVESGRVLDKLKNEYVGNPKTLYVVLSHYAKADEGPHVEKLIRFSDLAGGHAYGATFTERAEVPIAEMFGSKPD